MIRKSFRMSIHAGQEAEYARRHSPIWHELEEVLIAHGVRTYSIFLDAATLDLFVAALLFTTTLLAADSVPESQKPTLFLIGDSTVKNSTKGQVGWGSVI